MKDQPEFKFRKTLEDIRLHYDFLFRRGFRIASILFADQNNENWQVTLTANNFLIDIHNERGVVNLALGTLQERHHEVVFYDLQDMAQFINNGREFFYERGEFPLDETQQFMNIAGFLEKHLNSLLAQVEKENLPSLNLPPNSFTAQPKRTII